MKSIAAVVAFAFTVCLLLVGSLRASLRTDKNPKFVNVELLQAQKRVRGARMAMLADDPECVSWRGCSQSYDPETMATSTFYDRFDSYPNAWDASPAAKTLRATYPNGFPGTDEPTVIVSGDPLHAWPNQDFGVGYQGSYSPFKAFDTYYY